MKALIPELKARLDANKLQLVDLYLLLFESKDQALQQQAYEKLKANVQDAASIISMATTQQTDWESFDYVDIQHSQTAPFFVWLEVKINGNILTTVHPIEHQRKQPARHQACLSWIDAYLQDALVPPDQRVEPEPKVEEAQEINEPVAQTKKPVQTKAMHPVLLKKLKDGQNFIGMLDSVCQTLCWKKPEYECTEFASGFECECRLSAQGVLLTGTGVETKKQRAKNIAAWQLLEQMQAIAQQKWGEWSSGV
jgi:ribonuclease R